MKWAQLLFQQLWLFFNFSLRIWLRVVNIIRKLNSDSIDERISWDKLSVVNGVVIEVGELKENAGSNLIDVNSFLSNSVHMLSCGSTSVVAAVIFPVVVVSLDDEPFAGGVVESVNMSGVVSVS